MVTRRDLIVGGGGFAFLTAAVLQSRAGRDLAMLKALSTGRSSTPTPTATPTPAVDLVVNAGEIYSINTGTTENYRHALNGGTVRTGGVLQTDGTDS